MSNEQFFSEYGICEECTHLKTGSLWCNTCNAKKLKDEFSNWTSGNSEIDDYIQESQLKSKNSDEFIEWIPFERFKDVEFIASGGFGSVFKATWIDGYIDFWSNTDRKWKRNKKGLAVCLKSLHNSTNNIKGFLEEVDSQVRLRKIVYTISIYGITKDPKGNDYMMVMDYAKGGNLRTTLKENTNKLTWKDKLVILQSIITGLDEIHRAGMVHKDFHSGNIVMESLTCACITDFGLCKPIGEAHDTESTNIYGVLAYVAPEVLKGREYTKASDIYSFGIVMSEVLTGNPPYHEIPHDGKLATKICLGYRPKIRCKVPQLFLDLMNKCLDAMPENRPTSQEIHETIYKYWVDLFDSDSESEISRQCKEIEKSGANLSTHDPGKLTATNLHSIYTSQLLDYRNLPEPVNSTAEIKQLEYRIQDISIVEDEDDEE
ncbi:16056_t:CDS:2 [Acaulospora morrowiae]|uniref:16056_t:CDS:1 n=1 Tax=Acaulospora morrowiae TaxID=94023 RepID=A0A9N9FE66_9GLOM|nr:16056_t:CDS:2 [Acaulospora morrowiae]